MDEIGLQDASILLMMMGAEPASEIFKHLTPKEVQKIGETMAGIKSLPKTRIEEVLERFKLEAGLQSSLVDNTDDYVRDVLTKALGGEKANMLIDRILQGGDVSGIESLKWMTPDSIVELVRNEHPQIIASILVHLERDLAAAVLGRLEDRLRTDVTLRIATLDGIQPTALRELNDVLSTVLSTGDRMKKAAMGGTKTAAEILNFLGSSVEATVLESLTTADAELAQQIADQMFTFDDVMKLDDRSVQLVLREVQTDSLVVALKGADPTLREKIFKNMSSRAAESLKEDIESRGPMRVAEVEAEQKEITKTIRRLADEGQIAIGGGADDAFY